MLLARPLSLFFFLCQPKPRNRFSLINYKIIRNFVVRCVRTADTPIRFASASSANAIYFSQTNVCIELSELSWVESVTDHRKYFAFPLLTTAFVFVFRLSKTCLCIFAIPHTAGTHTQRMNSILLYRLLAFRWQCAAHHKRIILGMCSCALCSRPLLRLFGDLHSFFVVFSIVFAHSLPFSHTLFATAFIRFVFFWHSLASLVLLCVRRARASLFTFSMRFSVLYGLDIFFAGQTRQQTVLLLWFTIHISLFLFPLHAFGISNILFCSKRHFFRFPLSRLSSDARHGKKQF